MLQGVKNANSWPDSDNLTIETLDADYEDIESLHNLDVTNTMRCKTC